MNQAKRIALQQLRSLRTAGLNVMSGSTGEHVFDLGDPLEGDAAGDRTVPKGTSNVAAVHAPSTSSPTKTKVAVTKTQESKPSYLVKPNLKEYESDVLSFEERQQKLAVLNQEVAGCTRCKDLAECRTNTVFGVGNAQPELCFLGEGPGADEDRQGEPFVGQAGQLLNKIIEACKMSRDEVYILNTVKCRPPGNRNPKEDELANCWPYAIQQLELLQPKFICCLGSVAAKTLLQTTQSIGRMRGQFFQFRGSQVIVTYHPAYLLRNPSAKRQVWDDMKILLAAMGREI